MMLWQKSRANDQHVDKAPHEYGTSIYLEAYRYALDLCDNPAIAREVASRFSKSWKAREQAITEFAMKQAQPGPTGTKQVSTRIKKPHGIISVVF